MRDFIFLIHDDAPDRPDSSSTGDWRVYMEKLVRTGGFGGGSEIADGVCVNKAGTSTGITSHIVGYLLVQAESVEEARKLLEGNPVYEAGGTVEIRALPPME